jgi:hypothetical protein
LCSSDSFEISVESIGPGEVNSAAVVSNTFTFSEPLVENDDEEPSDGALNFGNTSESFQSAVDTTDTEYSNHNNNCIENV